MAQRIHKLSFPLALPKNTGETEEDYYRRLGLLLQALVDEARKPDPELVTSLYGKEWVEFEVLDNSPTKLRRLANSLTPILKAHGCITTMKRSKP